MLVVERERHISATVEGLGLPLLKEIIKNAFPNAEIRDDDDEYVDWEETDICKQIRANETPGLLLAAYREREGLTLVQLAKMVGTKYTNLSAMENNRRPIGLRMAKKLGEALHVDYTTFLANA